MRRARGWVACIVVTLAMGCTAITGADELTVDECADSACAKVDKADTVPGGSSGGSSSGDSGQAGDEKSPSLPDTTSSSGGSGATPPATFGQVACGTTTCSGAKPICCARDEGTSECIAADAPCNQGLHLKCSGPANCASGTVCCFVTNLAGPPFSECRAASACALPSVVLCQSNADCTSGSCSGQINNFDEYKLCSPAW